MAGHPAVAAAVLFGVWLHAWLGARAVQVTSQAAWVARWCLWSLRRLWVAVISRHSERAADLPRRWNWLIRRVVLGLSEHGLDHSLAFSVKPAAKVTGENGVHEGIAPAIPAAARCVALPGIGRDQDLGGVADNVVDLIFMPVAAVRDRDPGRVVHTDLL
jgi:hypothetical protein